MNWLPWPVLPKIFGRRSRTERGGRLPGKNTAPSWAETAETQESRKQRLRTLRELNRTLERFDTVSVERKTEQ